MTEVHDVRAATFARFGLTRDAIFRLFKTAIKDDEKLVDEAIVAVYDQMISFDETQADEVISLIIRRHRDAKCAFRAMLKANKTQQRPTNAIRRVLASYSM